MQILGLTGYYCSGKSSIEYILEKKHNFFIIDVDKIGHKALNEKKKIIVEEFGTDIVDTMTNSINRKKLGKIVFKNTKKLNKLNNILHPWMKEYVKNIINDNKKLNNNICISAALLFELELNTFCDFILIVKSSLLNIILRAKQRDHQTVFGTLRILKRQKLMKFYKRYKKNDDILIINNNKNKLVLTKRILKILKRIK